MGYNPPGFAGHSYYMAKNPPIGATITYWVKEKPKTLKDQRKVKEKGEENNFYPTADEIRAEDAEEKPYLIFVIMGPDGKEIRRISKDYSTGLKRITWDGRWANMTYIDEKGDPVTNNRGAMVCPGRKLSGEDPEKRQWRGGAPRRTG